MNDTPRSGITLDRIGQIFINVRHMERAVAFYRDALGMQFLFEVPGMAFFDCGGIRLLLGTAEQPGSEHPASIIYYKVDDIYRAHEELSARGVKFSGEPHMIASMSDHDLWMAFFEDTEGNTLALMNEMAKPAMTGEIRMQ